jgi:hypothetical protein
MVKVCHVYSYILFFYSKTNEMHQFLKFILFCSSTLHVSDGLSVHHQDSKTTYSIKCMSERFCWLFASKQPAESEWYDAVCTVLES